jgi:hypothetical protein
VTETRLGGGRGTTGVVRIGQTVHRPTGPWTPTIHAYLRHLRLAGFTAAPEVLGIDERGREVLTYLEGKTWGDAISPDEPKTGLVVPRAWPAATRSDQTLAAIGRLFADLQRAARGFRPTAPVWREHEIPMKDDEIVCQGDAGPWNIVSRAGAPVGLIDWDNARPTTPIEDLASVAWHFVPLGPEDIARVNGFDETFDARRRLRLLCDAYGLEEPQTILPALSLVKQLSAEHLRYWQPLHPGGAANWLRVIVADLDWLDDATPRLRAALR